MLAPITGTDPGFWKGLKFGR